MGADAGDRCECYGFVVVDVGVGVGVESAYSLAAFLIWFILISYGSYDGLSSCCCYLVSGSSVSTFPYLHQSPSLCLHPSAAAFPFRRA